MHIRLIPLVFGRLALATLAAALTLPAQAQMGGPALVRVAQATLKEIAPVALVPGTVVSRNDARLSAEVEGRLTHVAEVGTAVVAGEPVAAIEDTVLKLQMAEARAQVTRAEARVGFLESEETRFARLAESNLAALTQLEQTRSDRDVARGDLEVVRARLRQIADQLERTELRAPFSGVVVERLMTPGERVLEGNTVVRLVDPARLEVVARAPLDYLPYVRPGQALVLRSGAVSTRGVLRTAVAVGNENTHQFELRIDLEGQPFPVGQTLRVGVPTSLLREALTVPRDALVLRPEGQSVFVVDADGNARQVSVQVGSGQGEDLEVFGELAPGDRVVVRGNERLQAGQAVSIMDS